MQILGWFRRAFTVEGAAVFIAAYFSLSFVFSDFSISAVLGAIAFGLYTAVYCYVNRSALDKAGKLLRDRTAVLFIFFVLLVTLQFLRVFEWNRTIIYYLVIVACSTIILLLTRNISEPCNFLKGRIILIAAGSFAAMLNIAFWIFPDQTWSVLTCVMSPTSLQYNYRLTSEGYGISLGESIGYTGTLISMAIFALVSDVTACKKPKSIVLILPASVGLFLLQRRSEAACTIVILVIVWLLQLVRSKKSNEGSEVLSPRVLRTIIVEAVVVVLAFSLVAVTPGNDRMLETTKSLEAPQASANQHDKGLSANEVGGDFTNGRLILWQLAFEEFQKSPLTGNGWGYYAKVAPQSGNIHVTNAHNIVLQLLCETGVVGFALVAALFVSISVDIVQALRRSKENSAVFSNVLLSIVFVLFLLLEGLFDNTIYYSFDYLLLALSSMLISNCKKYDMPTPRGQFN